MNRLTVSQGHSYYTQVETARQYLLDYVKETTKRLSNGRIESIERVLKMDHKEVFKWYDKIKTKRNEGL